MADEQSSGVNKDFLEKQKGLRISELEDDDEEEIEQQREECAMDEFDEEGEEEEEFVTLGFVEKPKNHWSLLRQLFPSKAGGIPAWLDPPSDPPRHDGTDKPSAAGAALCSWCGTWKGDKLCSSCRTDRYCSEKHQVMHWRSGHKIDCQRMCISSDLPNQSRTTTADLQKVASNSLWPEYEMIIGNESEFSSEMEENNACNSNSLVPKDNMDDTTKSLLDNFEGDDDRKSWASFQERIGKAPEQVLRYGRDGSAKPLWPMSSGRPSKADIPDCKYCGGPLCFECQILPQLLYYFSVKNDVDSLGWGTIVVYTCKASFEASVAYKEEYAWVQLSLLSATVP